MERKFLLITCLILLMVGLGVAQQTTFFSDDFESGLAKWLVSGLDWDTTSTVFRAGGHCITDSRTGNYPPNANEIITTVSTLDLTGSTFPVLSFWHRYSIAPDAYGCGGNDHGYVEISSNAGFTWTTVKSYTGYLYTWNQVVVDLRNYRTTPILLRFRLASSSGCEADGWYVDDVQIEEFNAGPALSFPFSDGFESGTGNWITSGRDWDTTSATSRAGGHCITESRTGNYPSYANNIVTIYGSLDLTGTTLPVLSFWHKYSIAPDAYGCGGNDYGYVEISSNAGFTWTTVRSYTGYLYTWNQVVVDLRNYRTDSIKVRFRLASSSGCDADGWYVDDVQIEEFNAGPALSFPFSDGFESGTGNWITSEHDWDTTSATSRAGGHCITESRVGNYPVYANESFTLAGSLDLSGSTFPVLSFWHKYSIAPDAYGCGGNDYGYVEISSNAGFTWTTLKSYTGYLYTWNQVVVDLRNYRTDSIKVRFRLASSSGCDADGWYVDDVQIEEFNAGPALSFPFSDGFESGTDNWITSGRDWDTTSTTYRSGGHCITESRTGNYPSYANNTVTISGSLNLSSTTFPVLSFWHRYSIAPDAYGCGGNDYGYVEISSNAGFTWTTLKSYTGYLYTWNQVVVDLRNYRTDSIKVRFRLASSSGCEANGWYVDDVQIEEFNAGPALSFPFSDGFESGTGNWITSGRDWDTTSATSRAGGHCITESRTGNYPSYANNIVTIYGSLDLTGTTLPVLSFWHKYSIALDAYGCGGADHGYVEVSTNAGLSWIADTSFGGNLSTWNQVLIDLSNYRTDSIKVRFRLASSSGCEADGWYVDDVGIKDLAVSVKEHIGEIPTVFSLAQNYPNPFNPNTMINYQLPTASYVTLKVFDVLGREVCKLINGFEEPGYKSINFKTNGLASGMYYYRLQAGKFIDVKKMILAR